MNAGARARNTSAVPARLRLWTSSPICTAWALMARMSSGAGSRSNAERTTGASTPRTHRRCLMTSGP